MRTVITGDNNNQAPAGFSLLELMVVVAILAATAFIATGSYLGVSEHANDQLVRSEMQEIAEAIRRFKQDTGYYPGEGPFALSSVAADSTTDCPGMVLPDGGVDKDSLPVGADAAWFVSPANFRQLFERPELCDNHPQAGLDTWDAESCRGWRGPYIQGFAEGFVDIRDDINPDNNGANGSPLLGINIQDVWGIADPYEHRSESVAAGTLLDWSATPRFPDPPGRRERQVWGRPYLVFNLNSSPWIVSMGPDSHYNQSAANSDDITLNIQ